MSQCSAKNVSKPYDWAQLKAEFRRENADTGITVSAFAKARSINPNTAKSHIKISELVGVQASPEVQSLQRNMLGQFLEGHSLGAVRRFQARNSASKRHGAYAVYHDDEIKARVNSNDTLYDELELCRARIHSAEAARCEISAKLADSRSAEETQLLVDILEKIEEGQDRAIARVESIEKTIASIELDYYKAMKLTSSVDKDVVQIRLDELATKDKEEIQRDRQNGKVSFNIDW